jgi:4-amino-4-deoxychorismate lyase
MILVNGAPQDTISAGDRGLAYGDGVFRTLATRAGTALCWPHHFAKLAEDCRRVGITPPVEPVLLGEVEQVAQGRAQGAVKIIVTRAHGERGYALPANPQATRIVMGMPMPAWPAENSTEGIRARICDLRLSEQPRLAGIKHLNRLENVLARAEWDDPTIAEGLLLDQRGNLIEGVSSNVFIVLNGILVTPDLSYCGVAGVTRERILAWAQTAGTACEIRRVTLDELWNAEEIILCNSLIGVWRVREIGGRCCGNVGWTSRIRQFLAESHD